MEYIKLKDICDLKNGFAFKSSDYIEKSNVLNCRMSNIRPNATFDAEYNPKYLPDEFCEKYEEYLLNDGDLIIAMTDLANDPKLLGVPTIVDTKGYKMLLNQRVGKLTLIDKSRVIEPYLKYALSLPQHKNYFKKFAGGGLQINIGKQEILNLEIPYCEVKTQKKIVEVLDKAQELIDKRKEQIKALEELVKSRFIEMFGSPKSNPNNFDVVKFNDITDYIGDIGSNGANSVISANLKMTDTEDYALMVRTLNFTSNDFENNVKYVSKEVYDFFKKSQVFGGELIFNKIGSAGINFVMPYLNRPVSLGLNQIMVRTNEKVNITYLHTLLNTDYGKHQIGTRVQGAVTKSITKGAIKEIPIILPPIELQNEFADFVKQVDKLKSQMESGLKELEDNFNSLMQKAFKGELF